MKSANDKTLIYIGKRMRVLRQALGLTQAEVAEAADIEPSFYGQVERGANAPSLKSLLSIARALNVEAGDLLPSAKTAELPFHKTIDRILEPLPAKKKRLVLDMVRDMAEHLK